MLVLSRKEGERIKIGDDVFVTVVHITKDKVRIGIEAPLNTVILRDELHSIPAVLEMTEPDKISDTNDQSTNDPPIIKIA
ncbi:MAG: carbon storage regulator [Planctomycetaceae bacterium]|jgi:carbon storage regulator|nr:carbon storage regulator [Planctomycetaceae bacterium]